MKSDENLPCKINIYYITYSFKSTVPTKFRINLAFCTLENHINQLIEVRNHMARAKFA